MDANVIRPEEGSRVFEMQILGCTWEIVEDLSGRKQEG